MIAQQSALADFMDWLVARCKRKKHEPKSLRQKRELSISEILAKQERAQARRLKRELSGAGKALAHQRWKTETAAKPTAAKKRTRRLGKFADNIVPFEQRKRKAG